MNPGIAEIVGLFLLVVGCGTVVAAASLVSTPLAVLAAGLFLILGGVLATYVAALVDRAPSKPPRPSGERP